MEANSCPGQGEWLFHQHMLAGVKGLKHHPAMKIVMRRDQYGLNFGVLEHCFIVCGGVLRTELLRGGDGIMARTTHNGMYAVEA